MAEDELTQSGIRVGRWLPEVPAEPPHAPEPLAVPRRLPSDGDLPPAPAPDAPEPDEAGTPPVDVGAGDEVDSADAQSPPDAGPVPAPSTPGRHFSCQGVVELVAPVAARVRVAVGVAPDAPGTRVGAARARRRRRRVVLGAATTALLLVLAYTARGARPDGGGAVPAARPTVAPASAPVAAPPTIVPVTGNPALPGGPMLGVDTEQVPALVDLTALGARDWVHWGGGGGDSAQRKQTSTGEISDAGGPRLEHAASVAGFAWRDGTPVARQDGIRYGVFQRGADRGFSVSVAGSGDLRTVRFFVGAFSAGARLDVRLSAGGDPAVREVALAAGDRFFQYVIHFRAPRGERLLITWRALTVVGGENDGVTMEALTVS